MCQKKPVTEWKHWDDVFESWTVIPDLNKYSARGTIRDDAHTWRHGFDRDSGGPFEMYLSPFVSVKRLDQRIYLHVVPTKKVIEAITPHVIFVEYDTMNFEVIEWTCGRALVTCHNNKIIGGPWVAKIDASTIPAFPKESDS